MRILFSTTRGTGHVLPLLPFARACADAGHEVIVAGPGPVRALVDRAGLPFRPLAEASPEALAGFQSGQERLPPDERVVRAMTGLYVDLYARAALPAMLGLVASWRPDVIVRETAEYASLVAAQREGIPCVQVGLGLSTAQIDQLTPLLAPALERLGGAAAPSEPVFTLAPASLSSVAPAGRVWRFRKVTPPPRALARRERPPMVYVSFGTEVPSPTRPYFPGLYQTVLEALSALPVLVVTTIGMERDRAEIGPVPSNVRVERWLDTSDVLRDAAVMVGHGGAGSTLAALAAGVPMAILPFFADQPVNAATIADRGAGLVLSSAAEAADAVRTLLAEPAYARAAREVAAEIGALPPVDDAVPVLAELCAVPARA